MSPRYFQGRKLFEHVSASDAHTFKDVVDSLRICATLPIARTKFLALPKAERDELKRVKYLVPACFKTSPSRRKLENATHCNLIFIDLDELPDGTCPASPFYHNPDNLFKALDGFNFAAYITASSTPEKPRMRVVVDADKIPVSSYTRAVASIWQFLGISAKVNTESRVAVQPMFLPTMFSDSTEADHPLVAHHIEGRSFRVSDISESLFPEYDEPKAVSYGDDALTFLRAPLPEITLAVAREALFHIDPDCDYYEWMDVAFALRHQFSHTKGEEAFALFDEWSSGGEKYPGEEKLHAKWSSARSTPAGRLPVTIRTLLKLAAASGWDDRKVKETAFNTLVRWMEECESITELAEKGPQKILAAPMALSAVQEDILIDQLCKNAKRRFAHTISATAVRNDLKRIKAEQRAQEKPTEKVKEPLWAKGVCYISAADEFYRHRTGEKYRRESFNKTYSRWLLPTEEALKEAGKQITPAALASPVVNPDDYVLNHLKCATVYDYAYDPSQPGEMFFVNRGRKYVNTYNPTYPDLDPKNAEHAGTVLKDHLKVLIAERDYRRVLIDYFAFMVQSPGRKIRWAPLIQSVEGAGKTFLAEMMKAVLGGEHVKIISDTQIRTGYTEWAFGHQLVVLEEVRVIGENRHMIMNSLKDKITNDEIPINQKFRDVRSVPNISNYVAFSNYQDALALTPGDRRWFVLKSPLQHKNQVLALGESYFQKLFAMLRDYPGALRSWLNDWQISEQFNADGHAPRTTYAQEMVNDTAGDLTAAVRRLLLDGDYPLIQYDIVSTRTLLDVLNLEEGLSRISVQAVSRVLREEGFRNAGRVTLGEERHPLWIRNGVEGVDAPRVAADRLKGNKKNLCMELIYS